jgi:cellulose 1,4-beta-cellobiosidase
VPKCANADPYLRDLAVYAWTKLNLPNVAIYADVAHAGWLGWPGNLNATADLYSTLYKAAGSPKAVRGMVTNVSNYNGYALASPPNYTDPNPNYDEARYHAALSPYLDAAGFPSNFIVDQGRSGQQPGGRVEWGHWCNVRNSGFGTRPTTNTGTEDLDGIVWVKPGGESDGTSDETAERFDQTCVSVSAVTPAPEAGSWFQAYFEMLLRNANPSFV